MGKIEGLICRTLNKVLGNFVEDISADSLNLAVLSGRASLKNLQVRPECIQEMALPVKLNAGLIGSIVIDIPITSLLSKPIVVTIRDVLVSRRAATARLKAMMDSSWSVFSVISVPL